MSFDAVVVAALLPLRGVFGQGGRHSQVLGAPGARGQAAQAEERSGILPVKRD